MTVLDEVAAYLETNGIGTVGTDIFKGRMPETPNTAVALFEYDGLQPEFTHDSTTPYNEMPRLQVLVRSDDYATGRAKAEAVWALLNGVANTALSGTRYFRIRPLQSPAYLRRDENERPEFILNSQVMKAVS